MRMLIITDATRILVDAATEFEESLESLLDRMTLLRNEHLGT